MADVRKDWYAKDGLVFEGVTQVVAKTYGDVDRFAEQIAQEHNEFGGLKEGTSRLVDLIDLNRDEFLRIKACPSADAEIKDLCERAQVRITQNVPVIEQRDNAESVCRESNAVCVCGCEPKDHESLGEDGECCGHEDHECIRTSRSVAKIVADLRARVTELTKCPASASACDQCGNDVECDRA